MNHFLSSLVATWLTLWNWGGSHPPPTNHTLDLLVNGQNDPVAVVNITDAKPGDDWYIDKDLWVNKDAKIYLHLKDLIATEGAQTEPELQEPLHSDLQNYITYDLKIGSEIITLIPLPDAFSCFVPIGDISKNTHLTLTQSFHFDPAVTNWAQGDILTFTEEFTAVGGDGPVPDSGTGRAWDPTLKKCVPGPTPTRKPSHTPKPTRTPTPTPAQACTLTQGYWKNHPDSWPVSSLSLGSVSYTKAQLLSIFGQPVAGNGLISLAHQLIAAKLNIAAGSDATPILGVVTTADVLIGSRVVPPVGSGFLSPAITSGLIDPLDKYNSGHFCI